jgi:hypothetical protein
MWVVYLGFEKQGNVWQKYWGSKLMSFKNANFQKTARAHSPLMLLLSLKETLCLLMFIVHRKIASPHIDPQ